MQEKLFLYIDQHQSEMLDALEKFIAIPSISHQRSEVKKALNYALSLGNNLGFTTESLFDHEIGLIEMGQGEETLGILSHVDVVEPGDSSKWNTPPFQQTRIDNKLFGRGTLDDKGAIIAVLFAMKAVAQLDLPLHKKARLILGTREEIEWSDMEKYVQERSLPDYGFTPDGSFPICNIEKGGMDLELIIPILTSTASHNGTALPALVGVNSGSAVNVVPGQCKAFLSDEKGEETVLETQGKSVHSCQPEKGINALVLMGKEIHNLRVAGKIAPNNGSDFLEMLGDRFDSVYGEKLGLYSNSEYYQGAFVHRNAMSPTLANTKDGNLHVNFNVRFPFGADENKILRTFEELAHEFQGSPGAVHQMPAVYVEEGKPFLTAFAQAYEETTGLPNEFTLEYGGTYAKAIPNVVSWGPIFPGEEDTCHEENEYISMDSLIMNAKIFALAIAKILCAPESYR